MSFGFWWIFPLSLFSTKQLSEVTHAFLDVSKMKEEVIELYHLFEFGYIIHLWMFDVNNIVKHFIDILNFQVWNILYNEEQLYMIVRSFCLVFLPSCLHFGIKYSLFVYQ